MLVDFLKYLTRKKISVVFNDRAASKPISSCFGTDRGTPVDRFYIEKFLADHADLIRGRVLEIGESFYSRRLGGDQVSAFEVLHTNAANRDVTVVGDLTDQATLPKNAIDCFICTQTLNFIFDVHKAIEGAHYLLKPGGVILVTVAGISQISRYDMDRWGDYWRFTTASIVRLFQPIFTGGLEVTSFGNVLAATAFLQGIVVEDLPDPALLDDNDTDYQLVVALVAKKA